MLEINFYQNGDDFIWIILFFFQTMFKDPYLFLWEISSSFSELLFHSRFFFFFSFFYRYTMFFHIDNLQFFFPQVWLEGVSSI